MTVDEVKGIFKKVKEQGLTDEEITIKMFELYKAGKISFDEFSALVTVLGYKVNVEMTEISKGNKADNKAS